MTAIHTDTSDKQLHEINHYNDLAFPGGLYTVTRDGILPDGRGYSDQPQPPSYYNQSV